MYGFAGKTNLADLERAIETRDSAPEGLRQMTLRDDLARKGESLTLRDFDRFDGDAVSSGFMILRYNIEGGCVLTVHYDTPNSVPNYVRLSKRGYDPFDEALTVDIRSGTQAVAAYLIHSQQSWYACAGSYVGDVQRFLNFAVILSFVIL